MIKIDFFKLKFGQKVKIKIIITKLNVPTLWPDNKEKNRLIEIKKMEYNLYLLFENKCKILMQ